jgi:ubiquitin-small subunit ribosomal protein S27Ae
MFIKTLSGETLSVSATSVAALRAQLSCASGVESLRLLYGGYSLDDSQSFSYYGITEESTIQAALSVEGGAKKRKKKVYTKPKKATHKHIKNKLAILKFYNVKADGTVERLLKECPNEACGAGAFMAKHFNRHYCGKCSMTAIIKGMEGVAPPKPQPKTVAAAAPAAAGKAAAKKKK